MNLAVSMGASRGEIDKWYIGHLGSEGIIMKFRLWDMSWKEAEEAFKRSDTAILPVGTFHGHGPTPISIDSSCARARCA